MPQHRLVGADRYIIGPLAEHVFNGRCFGLVVEIGRGAVGIDIVDLVRLAVAVGKGRLQAQVCAPAVFRGCREAAGI